MYSGDNFLSVISKPCYREFRTLEIKKRYSHTLKFKKDWMNSVLVYKSVNKKIRAVTSVSNLRKDEHSVSSFFELPHHFLKEK